MPQKPPDLDEKKKPIVSAKPPDIDVEPPLDIVLAEAKQSLAPSVNRFEKSVNAVPVSDDEPTTFWSGFRKSLKDQILENTVGNPMLQAAAQPRGVDRAETLANLTGGLVLPTGIPPVVKTVKGMFAKGVKGTEKVVKDTVKVAEKTLESTPPLKVQSPVPETSVPIVNTEKVKKLPYKTVNGKLYLKEVTKENIDQIYKGGYELAEDGSIVKAGVKAPVDSALPSFSGGRRGGKKITKEPTINKETGEIADDVLPEAQTAKPPNKLSYEAPSINRLTIKELDEMPQVFGRLDIAKPYTRESVDILKDSISKKGLVQPIEVTINPGGSYKVGDGRHRVQALKELGIEDVPVKYTSPKTGGHITPKEAYAIEDVRKAKGNKPPDIPPNIPEELADDTLPPDGSLPPKDESSIIQKGYDLFRGLKSTDLPFITSAAFRQGSTQVGTIPWIRAWGKAAKAYGSKAASETMELARKENPLFKESFEDVLTKSGKPIVDKATGLPKQKRIPSYAEQVGLREGSLKKYSKRDEQIRGELAEKIPLYGRHIASSNRAYNEFINHVMESKFTSMIDDAEKLAESARKTGKAKRGFFTSSISDADMLDPKKNLTLGKEIAEFVNTSLKRGKLGFEVGKHEGNLEKHSRALANIFFSPRNMASEVRMLNPSTYIMATPQVRYEYMMNMARRLSMWTSIAGLAKISGAAEVSLEPTNPDFGKLKFSDTRVDLPGGLQQFIVLANQIAAGGKTSSNSGKFNAFGTGNPYSGTEFSQMMEFGKNRLHPTVRYPIDFFSRTEKVPFRVGDRTFKMITPMFLDDMAEVGKNNPELAPIIGMITSAGIGTQTYEKGKFGKPTYPMLFPENRDFNIGRK